jgi:carboxyl-terminal processing protease
LSVLVAATGFASFAATEPLPPLQLQPKYVPISTNVAKLIEELHYSLPRLDNSLSSAILDRYLDTLDGNRMYFTSSDIASFNRLRYELDDRTRTGDLQPVFDIFNLFRKRAGERIDAAIACSPRSPTTRSKKASSGIEASCRGPQPTKRSTRSGAKTSRATACGCY